MVSGGDRRYERIRLQNVRIAAGARRHHFDERIGIPFLCECDDEGCREYVVVKLLTFERSLRDHLTVISRGHTVAGSSVVASENGYVLVRLPSDYSRSA